MMTAGKVYNYDKFGKSCVQYIHEFKDHNSNTCLPVIYSLRRGVNRGMKIH